MELRAGTADDVDGALAVWQRSLAEQGARPGRTRLAELRAELVAPGVLLLVAVDGAVVGLALGVVLGPEVRVDVLAVEADRRRQGVGGQLLERLADAAYLRGARRLWLEADSAGNALLAMGLTLTGSSRALASGPVVERYDAELDPPVRDVAVRATGLRLGQLLKLAGLAETGSQAKALLGQGGVQVNGQTELRRGRQLAPGDVVVADDRAVRVVPA